MDVGDACDTQCCCCACDVDLYDCDCELECCDGACEDTGDVCDLQDGLASLCCGCLICADSDASGNVKDDKRIALNKAASQAPQVAPVRVELTGISNYQPSKPPEEPQVQFTSL